MEMTAKETDINPVWNEKKDKNGCYSRGWEKILFWHIHPTRIEKLNFRMIMVCLVASKPHVIAAEDGNKALIQKVSLWITCKFFDHKSKSNIHLWQTNFKLSMQWK